MIQLLLLLATSLPHSDFHVNRSSLLLIILLFTLTSLALMMSTIIVFVFFALMMLIPAFMLFTSRQFEKISLGKIKVQIGFMLFFLRLVTLFC
jgi:hypothetical protein